MRKLKVSLVDSEEILAYALIGYEESRRRLLRKIADLKTTLCVEEVDEKELKSRKRGRMKRV